MPFFVSQRYLSGLQARIDRAEFRAESVEAEVLELGRANGRLARAVQLTEAAAANIASAYRVGRRELLDDNDRLRAVVDQQAATIRDLNASTTGRAVTA